jgi:hypothetical protein
MNLGAVGRPKVIFLCVLGVGAAYSLYINVLAGPDTPRSAPARATALPAPAIQFPDAGSAPVAGFKRPRVSRGRSEEFIPVLRSKNPADRPDLNTIDPTLNLELLAKVQAIGPAGGTRNLFQVGPKPVDQPGGSEPVVKVGFIPYGPQKPPPPPPPPGATPPPPIPYKFYGIATVRNNGKKTAYFLDGDEIFYASEGDTLKRRYRIVRIGPNSVLMEDTESKREQTLPLAEEAQS